ncbi:MAG: hypothetical protein ACJ70Y_08510 [Nitrososphaera sp.]
MEANSPTVAACLSVRLVLRAAKATTAYGKNLVAGNIVRQLSKLNLEQYRSSLIERNGPGGI